jgi:biotin carboxylase
VRIAAETAEVLRIPHPIPAAVAVTCTDKIAQRTRLDAAGVPQPRWSTDAPPSYPCVVKAPDRQGQRAMSILPASAYLAEAALRAASGSRSGRVLYEAFVPGPEVTVNGFTAEGRGIVAAVTDRIHFDDAPGVAQRHVYPPERDPAAAAEAATRAVAALGIEAGPWYVQVILGPDGPRIVEVAARLGGGHDSELVKLVTGVDLARAAVLAALGRPVAAADVTPDPEGAGVIRFLEAPPGTLVRAAGPPDACFYDAPGHVYGPIRIATDRAGYVLAGGATRDAALARAAADAAAVRFEMT